MLVSVTQVSRTYRTQALWYAAEDAWKRTVKQLVPSSSKAAKATNSYGDKYIRQAQSAAQDIASVLTAAQKLKQTSDHARLTDESEKFGQSELQELIDQYNGLLSAVNESTPPMKNGNIQPMMSQLEGIPLNELGIIQQPDGLLMLDADTLDRQASNEMNPSQDRIHGLSLFALAVKGAADRFLAQPSEQLLDRQQGLFQVFANYHHIHGSSQLRTYLPVPMTGLLLNSYL
jgi:hypothetical protein